METLTSSNIAFGTNWLQFGHDLSVVEKYCIGKCYKRVTWLQFGHDLAAVETLTSSNNCIRNKLASIRPRPFSRGNQVRISLVFGALPRFNSATTFQPWKRRLEGRTYPASHRFNSATTFQPWKQPRPVCASSPQELLQFGHDLSAVETAKLSAKCSASGPASIQQRPFSRGNLNGLSEVFALAEASIRPRPFSRGNLPIST